MNKQTNMHDYIMKGQTLATFYAIVMLSSDAIKFYCCADDIMHP